MKTLKRKFPFQALLLDTYNDSPGLKDMLLILVGSLETFTPDEKGIIMMMTDFSLQAEMDRAFADLIKEKYALISLEKTPDITTRLVR